MRRFFKATLNDFYKKLDDKTFWSNQVSQDIALEALAQDYLKGGRPNLDSVSFEAAINEYWMRKEYINAEQRNKE